MNMTAITTNDAILRYFFIVAYFIDLSFFIF